MRAPPQSQRANEDGFQEITLKLELFVGIAFSNEVQRIRNLGSPQSLIELNTISFNVVTH